MVLSLLYPHLKLNQIEFHQDHIHPSANFDYDEMKELGIIESNNGEPSWTDVFYKKDKLPNLQLLEGRENESKNATPFVQWFETNVTNKNHYIEEHYIPKDIPLDFKMFNDFYDKRKALLKTKLQDILRV